MNLVLYKKLYNALMIFIFWIDAYSFACYQSNSLIVFSLNTQEYSVDFGWNCLGEFSACLMQENVECEATFIFYKNNQTLVNGIYSIFQYTTSTKPKTCVITMSNDAGVVSCSRMYTQMRNNGTVLMLRENKNNCFRTGFVPLNQWSILETDFVIPSDVNGYYSGVCIENVQQTTTLKPDFYDHTTKSMFTSKIYSSVRTTNLNNDTAILLSTNASVGIINQDKNHYNHNKHALIISLCVVFGVLILTAIFVVLFHLQRKRCKQMKSHKVKTRSEFENIGNVETTQPRNSHNNINSNGHSSDIIRMQNINGSKPHQGDSTSENINKDYIDYATYNAISTDARHKNDTFLTDGNGYLVPSLNTDKNMVFQNEAYTYGNEKDFDYSNYEDVNGKNGLRYSVKSDTSPSDSVYDVYNSETQLNSSEANTSYQNVGLDQAVHPIDRINPNKKEDKENITRYEIQGIVLEEFQDMGESQDYENLDTVNLDSCNHTTRDSIMDEILINNTEKQSVYFILEENQ